MEVDDKRLLSILSGASDSGAAWQVGQTYSQCRPRYTARRPTLNVLQQIVSQEYPRSNAATRYVSSIAALSREDTPRVLTKFSFHLAAGKSRDCHWPVAKARYRVLNTLGNALLRGAVTSAADSTDNGYTLMYRHAMSIWPKSSTDPKKTLEFVLTNHPPPDRTGEQLKIADNSGSADTEVAAAMAATGVSHGPWSPTDPALSLHNIVGDVQDWVCHWSDQLSDFVWQWVFCSFF